ncbi:MAG: DUF3237 domain-containing protein [Gammaproteobacteria bacterium]|nr:MAG: DUF3237 domain-containing protein [Gammaproteobacteria bacterium]
MAETENLQPSTQITSEYLMTYVAPLDPPVAIDDGLLVVNVRPGGWVKGSNINGQFVAPGADWLRIMPSGAMRLDVRGLIETDDGAFIYISYNGIIKSTPEGMERLNNGEVLTDRDIPYFIAAPTFQTASEKYAWLNDIQTINKMTEIQFGPEGYVKYDVFLIR